MATRQFVKRHAMTQPIDELIMPTLVRRGAEFIWQLQRWVSAGKIACGYLTVDR